MKAVQSAIIFPIPMDGNGYKSQISSQQGPVILLPFPSKFCLPLLKCLFNIFYIFKSSTPLSSNLLENRNY